MKYINNNPQLGIEIDWKLIRKEFKRLKTPSDVYNPAFEPFEKAKYHILLSERSIGKTTNLLIIGMLLHSEYGIIPHYIRTREEYLAPKHINNLFNVIINFGYVKKITNDRWNSCVYHARRWYYCNVEDGEIIEQDTTHFMMCMSTDNNETYKSSYTCDKADYIIYDEFISRYYYPDSFMLFMDLLKTLIRDRLSPVIVMSANTINKQSIWFDEFCIKRDISNMTIGDSKIVNVVGGTSINIHIIGLSTRREQKRLNNSLFFGFNNPKLSSITGTDWSMELVPHIPKEAHDVLSQNHYIKYSNELVRLTVVNFELIGIAVLVTNATKIYDDSVIYTTDAITDKRYRYGIGFTQSDKMIWDLFRKNKFYYATNEQGSIVKSYLELIKKY